MHKTIRISDLQSKVKELGIDLSVDQLRKLEAAGIVFTTQAEKGIHRSFTEEQFSKSLRNLLLYYFNTPIKDIQENNPLVIGKKINKIKQGLRIISRQ